MLAIDIFDQESGKPVWHAVVRKRVTRPDRDQTQSMIDKAIASVLQTFPPR